MKQEPILLIGAGGHAMACIDVVEQEGRFRIAGLLGRRGERGSDVLGYPVMGMDEDLPGLLHDIPCALVAVGQIKTPALRISLFDQASAAGYRMPRIISPHAHVSSHAEIGEGTIVMHGAIVNAGARVGRNCIINSNALIEHGVETGDHCHVATHAAINSGVTIGNGSFVGSGSIVRQSVRIGSNCVIGMGQHVLKDCADDARLPQTGDLR